MKSDIKPFPLPVVMLGAGSQPVEESPECLEMPTDMGVYLRPRAELDDPVLTAAVRAQLVALRAAMLARTFGDGCVRLDLMPLSPEVRAGLNEALGEGEVAIQLRTDDGLLRIQETAFAGIWRVLADDAQGRRVEDAIEAGPIPARVREVARAASRRGGTMLQTPLPEGVMNSPALLHELADLSARRSDTAPAHVMNLTLLPLSPGDVEHLVAALGEGSVSMLSRGYGNCRIASTGLRDCWWVQYFNSNDKLILNTLEVTAVPEAALAAAQDWEDSLERLAEWIEVMREAEAA
jgi:hydrogenase-1 operon protein HyaF